MHNLRQGLLRIASELPPGDETRREILSALKVSGKDPHMEARAVVGQGLREINRKLDQVLKKLAARFKSELLEVDLKRSWVNWELHGSDGVRVEWGIYFTDKDPMIRSKRDIELLLQEKFDIWGSVRAHGPDQWEMQFGDY
jgi:hypothetical protein